MKKIPFFITFIMCLFFFCFPSSVNAEDFKIAVSFTDRSFFLEPFKTVNSKLIVSNIGSVDAEIFMSAEIEKDAPFEIIFATNPVYLYADGIYDAHFLINSESYNAKEIRFSIVSHHKKIKKEQKKIHKIRINVIASPIHIFTNEKTIRANIKHQYQYEIKAKLSDDFIYTRDKKLSFYTEENKSEENEKTEENIQYDKKEEENETMLNLTKNKTKNLYFGKKDEKEKKIENYETSLSFLNIIIIMLGIIGIILAFKY